MRAASRYCVDAVSLGTTDNIDLQNGIREACEMLFYRRRQRVEPVNAPEKVLHALCRDDFLDPNRHIGTRQEYPALGSQSRRRDLIVLV
jgi:hypothetical protein